MGLSLFKCCLCTYIVGIDTKSMQVNLFLIPDLFCLNSPLQSQDEKSNTRNFISWQKDWLRFPEHHMCCSLYHFYSWYLQNRTVLIKLLSLFEMNNNIFGKNLLGKGVHSHFRSNVTSLQCPVIPAVQLQWWSSVHSNKIKHILWLSDHLFLNCCF